MASRIYYYNEDLTRSTTATTDFSASKISVTFTGNANKTYLLLWSCLLDASASSAQAQARLRNVTDNVVLGLIIQRLSIATNEKHSTGGMAIYAAGASPAEHTFAIEYASSAGTLTTGISDASVLALELDDTLDKWHESTGNTTDTTGTYAAKNTLSWTPGSARDYLILASAESTRSDSGTDNKHRIYNGATAYSELNMVDWRILSAWAVFFAARYATGLSGAQTWTNEFARAGGTGTSTVRNGRMVALDLTGFLNAWAAEDRTPHNSTSTTYVASSATITQTPVAVDHLLIACGITTSGGSYGSLQGNKVVAAGSDVGITANADTTGYAYSWFITRKRAEAASSTTWVHQYNRISGSDTVTTDENVIAVLQLASAETTASPTGFAATSAFGSVSFVSGIQSSIPGTFLFGTPIVTNQDASSPLDVSASGFALSSSSGHPPVIVPVGFSGGPLVIQRLSPGVSEVEVAAALENVNNDVVELEAGTYSFDDEIYVSASARTKEVILRPVEGAEVIFTGTDVLGQFIIWEGSKYITIDGLIFDGYNIGANGIILAQHCSDLKFRNLIFRNYNGIELSYHSWAIYLSKDNNVGHRNILIENVVVEGTDKNASALTGGDPNSDNIVIRNVTISDVDYGLFFRDGVNVNAHLDGIVLHNVGSSDYSIYMGPGMVGDYQNICADQNTTPFYFIEDMNNLGNVYRNPAGGCPVILQTWIAPAGFGTSSGIGTIPIVGTTGLNASSSIGTIPIIIPTGLTIH